MKPKKIKPETLAKYHSFLIDMLKEINANYGKEFPSSVRQNLCNRYKIPYTAFNSVIEEGFVIETAPKKYKAVLENAEPIHARKVYLLTRKKCNNSNEGYRNMVAKKKLVKKQTPAVVKKQKISPKKSKTFSLFWGLIKFNY